MRTDNEIKKMFEDMGLETEEKRSQFNFSYSYSAENDYKVVPFIRADTMTKKHKEDNNAELE